MKLILAVLAFASLCAAQEAHIIIVDQADSKELSTAYHEYKAAQARWEALKNEKAAHYTTEPKLDKQGKQVGKETQTMPGWEQVQFSADFRALVPANSQYAGRSCLYGYNGTIWNPSSSGTYAVGTSTTYPTMGAITTSGAMSFGSDLVVDQNGANGWKGNDTFAKPDTDGLAPIKTVESSKVK